MELTFIEKIYLSFEKESLKSRFRFSFSLLKSIIELFIQVDIIIISGDARCQFLGQDYILFTSDLNSCPVHGRSRQGNKTVHGI